MEEWIIDVVRELGVVGIALLMFAENVFPPLPSEVIMPLAGYLSSRDEVGFGAAVAAGSLGSLAGATLWYAAGRLFTRDQLVARIERHGVWLAMTTEDVDRATEWFRGHGRFSVLLGRLVPVVRTLISVPAGFTRMPLPRFLALSAVGTTAWTAGLTYAGRLLGSRFGEIDRFIGTAAWVVIAICIAVYVARVLSIRRRDAAS